MINKTSITWATHTWNPTSGCTQISAGCKNCYAKTLHDQRHDALHAGKRLPEQYRQPFGSIQLHPSRLLDPLKLRSKTPARIFVGSMSDLFHPLVPDAFLDRVFASMILASGPYDQAHRFLLLTKRPERMRDYLLTPGRRQKIAEALPPLENPDSAFDTISLGPDNPKDFLGPNIWLGTTAEDQQQATQRIPILTSIPAQVRFLSCEPLIGPVNLKAHLHPDGIHWVIVGGESGKNARPMHPDWARQIRDDCQEAHTPFHFKQWGEFLPIHQFCDPIKYIDGAKRHMNKKRGDVLMNADGTLARDGRPETKTYPLLVMARAGTRKAGRDLDGVTHHHFPEVTAW